MIYSDINVLKSNEIIYGQTAKAQRLFPDIEQYILDIISSYEVDKVQTIVILQILQLLLWTKSRLFFTKNVHAVQSGCMDHKWNKKIRIQLQSKKGKPSAIYLCMAPVSLPKVHGFKHRFPKQSRSQDIFCATAGHIWNAEMGVFAVRPKGLFLGQKGTQN